MRASSRPLCCRRSLASASRSASSGAAPSTLITLSAPTRCFSRSCSYSLRKHLQRHRHTKTASKTKMPKGLFCSARLRVWVRFRCGAVLISCVYNYLNYGKDLTRIVHVCVLTGTTTEGFGLKWANNLWIHCAKLTKTQQRATTLTSSKFTHRHNNANTHQNYKRTLTFLALFFTHKQQMWMLDSLCVWGTTLYSDSSWIFFAWREHALDRHFLFKRQNKFAASIFFLKRNTAN